MCRQCHCFFYPHLSYDYPVWADNFGQVWQVILPLLIVLYLPRHILLRFLSDRVRDGCILNSEPASSFLGPMLFRLSRPVIQAARNLLPWFPSRKEKTKFEYQRTHQSIKNTEHDWPLKPWCPAETHTRSDLRSKLYGNLPTKFL